MSNIWNESLPQDIQAYIKEVIECLDLKGFDIYYDPKFGKLQFRQGYHTATVLVNMVKDKQWADIRHIFRAALEAGPQVINYQALNNEWDRFSK